MAAAHHADAVAHRRRRPAPRAAHRTVAGREHEGVTLADDGRRAAGLGPGPLLDDEELAAGVVDAGLRRGRRPPGAGTRGRRTGRGGARSSRPVHSAAAAASGAAGRRRGTARASRRARPATVPAGRARSAQSRAIGRRCGQNAARSSATRSGQRVVEVAVLALAEAVARHVDRRPEASVLVVEVGERPALGGGQDRTGRRAAEVVELGGDRRPVQAVDPLVHRRCATASRRRVTPPSICSSRPWPRRRRRTGRSCRRCARPGGTARRAGAGSARTRFRPPAPPPGSRPPRQPSRSSRSSRRGCRAGASSTVRRKPCASWRSTGRSNRRRRRAKYSSSCRATSSRRRGARRMRGLISAASVASTASWSSRSKATRTSPSAVAASSSGPTGLSSGAVGDVEQALAVGLLDQPVVEPGRAASGSVRGDARRACRWRSSMRFLLGSACAGWRCRRRRGAGRPPPLRLASARRSRRTAARRGSGRRRPCAARRAGPRPPTTARCRARPRRGSSVARRRSGKLVRRAGRAGARPDVVDRLAVGDGDQPAADVAVRPQRRVGAERGQERLGPGVLRVARAEQRPAHPHHDRPVLGDDLLERSLVGHGHTQ